MRLRFKSVLWLIVIIFLAVGAIGIGYFFYKENKDVAKLLVDQDLTINYLDGDFFSFKKDGEVNISITNNSSELRYYYIRFANIMCGDVKYSITSSDKIKLNGELKSDIVLNQVSIDGNKTVTYKISFTNNSKTEYSGNVIIGNKEKEDSIFSEAVLNNNIINKKYITKPGEISGIDEGLITYEDDDGTSYYFRGSVENNYVTFAGLKWRIIKINPDGSVKLVLDTIISELSKYYDKENYDYKSSTINKTLNNWFDRNLKDYSDFIVYAKYCNDSLKNDKVYQANVRIKENQIPTYTCLGDEISLKIGLLTADEVMLAGGSFHISKDYYLYNSNIETPYFTMTSSEFKNDTYYPFVVEANGRMNNNSAGNLLRGVRPVINIIKTAKVSGSGTNNDPYKIITK